MIHHDVADSPSAPPDDDALHALRLDVRRFLQRCIRDGVFEPQLDGWLTGFSREFSKLLAEQGWVGMTIPKRYGGAGRSYVERFVVAEELLAAGAPVTAHWANERQFAPQLLRIGTEEQRQRFLPAIARAEVVFVVGLSEPDSGSDLASIRCRAVPTDGGWLLSGQKIWTTAAHHGDYMIVLCRTSMEEDRHDGMSQLIVDLRAPGVEIRPIAGLNGEAEFCEVFFDDVFVPDADVLGDVGEGWRQALAELNYERSGPDRYMSTFPLLTRYAASADLSDPHVAARVGDVIAQMASMRSLALGVVEASEAGVDFGVDAALAKDAGTTFEQDSLDLLREAGLPESDAVLRRLFDAATLAAPTFTLRGGTNEILRTITAKELLA
ncbi:MAG TPA: acyl-CoA dehydrogenase family protein [Capillimicrobium sp.]|nr:acyl-CoA dehydrogenase family protein [Capillimicrobium sp.]